MLSEDKGTSIPPEEAKRYLQLQQDADRLKRELEVGVALLDAKMTALKYFQEAIGLRLGITGALTIYPDGTVKEA